MKRAPVLLVLAACLFNALAYQSELSVAAPDINDDVFHFGLIQRMNAAWDAGGNPLDTWIGYWGQGFPVLRYYQHLPHLVVVGTYRLLGGLVPLHAVFDGMTLLLLSLLPLSFYVGTRRLGAAPMTAACIALCVPLVGADPDQRHFLGFQAQSFLWSGGGLFTQLMAMALFPVALGNLSRAVLQGRAHASAIGWLGATWLSHLVLGYTACLLGLVLLLHPAAHGARWRVALHLGLIYAGVATLAAYLLLPTLLESQWLARSIWEPSEYWDSYGAQRVLAALATGGLLDGNRIAVLTVLAAVGAFFATRSVPGRPSDRGQDPQRGFMIVALAMFIVALLLFFGRPTWGPVLKLLPFSANLPMHRFICAVQFGGLLLAGVGLSQLAALATRQRAEAGAVLPVLVVAVILSPAIVSTLQMAQRNATWRKDAAVADAAAGAALERAFADFRSLEQSTPGRGYAGAGWDWGRDFRIGGTPVHHRWSGHDLPAIAYMYHTMSLSSDLEPAFDPRRRDHYELFNVRYLLADSAQRFPPFAEPRLASTDVHSALVRTEGFFGVGGSAAFFRYERGESQALRELNRAFITGKWHDGDRFVRIGWREGDAPAGSETEISAGGPFEFDRVPTGAAPRGKVISSAGSGDRYRAQVELDDPGIILFRMTYHPNWRAELDGRPAETLMVSPGYVAVRASPGRHVLEMTYRSPWWTTALPSAGLALLVLVAAAEAWSRRRPG
jgi:hypothetical protein